MDLGSKTGITNRLTRLETRTKQLIILDDTRDDVARQVAKRAMPPMRRRANDRREKLMSYGRKSLWYRVEITLTWSSEQDPLRDLVLNQEKIWMQLMKVWLSILNR
jgi:hypothetical protein